MKFNLNVEKEMLEVGDVIIIDEEEAPRMICSMPGRYFLINLNNGTNTTTYYDSVYQLMKGLKYKKVIKNNDLILSIKEDN